MAYRTGNGLAAIPEEPSASRVDDVQGDESPVSYRSDTKRRFPFRISSGTKEKKGAKAVKNRRSIFSRKKNSNNQSIDSNHEEQVNSGSNEVLDMMIGETVPEPETVDDSEKDERKEKEVKEEREDKNDKINANSEQGIDLYVQVASGHDLPIRDASGTSDPYCIITSGSQIHRTSIIKKNLNPVWNETFVFRAEEIKTSDGKLHFEVWDSDDWTKDDFMGKGDVNLRELNMDYSAEEHTGYTLHLRDPAIPETHDLGYIRIAVWWAISAEKHSDSKDIQQTAARQPSNGVIKVSSLLTPPGVGRLLPTVVHSEKGALYEEPSLVYIVLKVKQLNLIHPGETWAESCPLPRSRPTVRGVRSMVHKINKGKKTKRHAGKDEKQGWRIMQAFGRFRQSTPKERADTGLEDQPSLRPTASSELSLVGNVVPQRELSFATSTSSDLAVWDGFSEELSSFETSLTHEVDNDDAMLPIGGRSFSHQESVEEMECSIVDGKVQVDPYWYYQATFAEQRQQSPLVRFIGEAVSWPDGSVFVAPLPLKDRNIRLNLYATNNKMSKQKRKILLRWDLNLFELLDGTNDEWPAEGIRGLQGKLHVDAVLVHSDVRPMLHNIRMRTTSQKKSAADHQQPNVQKGQETPLLADSKIMSSIDDWEDPETAVSRKIKYPVVGSLSIIIKTIELLNPVDCYCVMKCGPHWCKTETQPAAKQMVYGWELQLPVYEPATLVSFAVFSDPSVSRRTKQAVHGRIESSGNLLGKLQFRLSTLNPGEQYSNRLPFRSAGAATGTAVLQVKVDWPSQAKLLLHYFKSKLPADVYQHGLDSGDKGKIVKHQSRKIVMRWLEGSRPKIPLQVSRKVMNLEHETFARKRTKVHVRRMRVMFSALAPVKRKWGQLKTWENPWESIFGCLLCALFAFFPKFFIAAVLMYFAGLMSLGYRSPSQPPLMDENPLVLEETKNDKNAVDADSHNPYISLKAKYDKLNLIAIKVQNALDMLATFMERIHALVTWRDPMATRLFTLVLFIIAVVVLAFGLRITLCIALVWQLRPPCLQKPTPPPPVSFFVRLPSKSDQVL